MKKWLRAQPVQPATIAELQALLDRLRRRATTTADHTAPCPTAPPRPPPTPPGPKPPPAPTATPTPTTASATTRIDKAGTVTLRIAGQLHHIGIGRTHARTHVILLVHDLDVRVVNAATGELLRDLTLDPTPRLPAHRQTTRTHQKRTARTYNRRSGLFRCLETSHGRADRI